MSLVLENISCDKPQFEMMPQNQMFVHFSGSGFINSWTVVPPPVFDYNPCFKKRRVVQHAMVWFSTEIQYMEILVGHGTQYIWVIDQACSTKMAEYWPSSFFACLWTSTPSRSINTQKKNLANIQASWPHTWSITHTFCRFCNILWLRTD